MINYKSTAILSFIAVVLLVAIYVTRPFPDTLGSYSASIDGLTNAQRRNICYGASKINGRYLKPGEVFSFNGFVGPRTLDTGFVPSGALFENNVVESVGGGICLLSSTIYNALLRTDLKIIERVPHSRLISSMPPGLDATVWYGINDLKFQNSTGQNIKLEALCSYSRLNIAIKGENSDIKPEIFIQKSKVSENKLQVNVYRKYAGKVEKVSEDTYYIR